MGAILFAEFRRRYLHVLSGPRYSPATRLKMAQVLRQLADLGVMTTDDLTTARLIDYTIARSTKVCANTVRGELTYARAAVNYAIEEDWLDRGPKWRRIWPRKSPRKRQAAHSIENIRRVLDHLERDSETWQGHRLYTAAAIAAYTGLRRDEILCTTPATSTWPAGSFASSTGDDSRPRRRRRPCPSLKSSYRYSGHGSFAGGPGGLSRDEIARDLGEAARRPTGPQRGS